MAGCQIDKFRYFPIKVLDLYRELEGISELLVFLQVFGIFGVLEFWDFRILGFCLFGNSAFWSFAVLEFLNFGSMEFRIPEFRSLVFVFLSF